MNQNTIRSNQVYGLLPFEIEGVDLLAELALDLRWSWNHAADELWAKLDPALWELTRNPWVVLQTVSHLQLERQLADPVFRQLMKEHKLNKEQNQTAHKWFPTKYPGSQLSCIAYFSMEYMLSEALPIYVGGLGNVAGDQLKSANDLGLPVTAIGLLYQQGYFRQDIDKKGAQQEYFPYNDPGSLPIMPLRLSNGEWLRIRISLPGYPVWVRTWQVQVGDIKLYLLDSNDPANLPIHRGITSEIYGGGTELRIKQEMILGIGGWKVLTALNLHPSVCHLNEGHSAFAVLERASEFMKETGLSFDNALATTRVGNIFTTHTIAEAGFDRFHPSLMQKYFTEYVSKELKIDFDRFLALGRRDPSDKDEHFNMALLAFRGCGAANAVSKLHCEMSKNLFGTIFPRWPISEVPVGFVTNGIHVPSWDSKIADTLWTNACGKDRWKGDLLDTEEHIAALDDDALWRFRNESRTALVKYVRDRFERQSYLSGLDLEISGRSQQLLHPDHLTLGFARRFVPYKRTNLLLKDPQRLVNILTSGQHPVQLIIAGKAPPYDDYCKSLIRQWNDFVKEYNLYDHVVFLSDYDMHVAENLVQGVDVWINTPRRPWEACGTSGMKILVNGGINLSVLDGWWAEAYTPEVGWAISGAGKYSDQHNQDANEANELYELLEQQVVPEFYQRNEKNIPLQWVEKMRKSMSKLTPAYSANRTVREYTEKYYLPAANELLQRLSNDGIRASKLLRDMQHLRERWAHIRFGESYVEFRDSEFLFTTVLYLDHDILGIISVELFANSIQGDKPEIHNMQLQSNQNDEHRYSVTIPATRSSTDYTVRVVPCYEGVRVPMEDAHVLWQH